MCVVWSEAVYCRCVVGKKRKQVSCMLCSLVKLDLLRAVIACINQNVVTNLAMGFHLSLEVSRS